MTPDELVEHNMALAHGFANKAVTGIGCPFTRSEVRAAAMSGLGIAALRFDPSQGFQFSTYAVPVIRGSIIDYFRSRDGRPSRTGRPGKRQAPGCLVSVIEEKIAQAIHEPPDLDPMLARLKPSERALVTRHYLNGEPQESLARELGVTGSRVSQILAAALRRMRGLQ